MSVLSKHWFTANLALWAYIALFKVGGVIYFSSLSTLGERVMPIWIVGLLIGGSSFIQLLMDVPAGLLLDRFGYTRLLRLSTAILSLGGILLVVFGLTSWVFILLNVIGGFGWLFFGPGVDAYLLSIAPRKLVGSYMGVRRSMSSLGVVIGTSALAFLLISPISVLGGVIAATLLVATLLTFGLQTKTPSVHKEVKIPTQHYYVRRTVLSTAVRSIRKLNPASGLLAFSGFASATFYAVLWFVIPLYLTSASSHGAFDYSLGIFDATAILCGGIVGKLADTKRKRFYVFLGLLLFATFGTLLGFHLDGWFIVFGFIASLGEELSTVSLWAWMNELNHDHAHDGLVASIICFFEDAGWVVGPILAGFVYSRFGISWTILLGSLLILVSWLMSAVVLLRGSHSIFHSGKLASAKPHRYTHKD